MIDTVKTLNTRFLLVPKVLYATMGLVYYTSYTYRGGYLKEIYGIESKDFGLIASSYALVAFLCSFFWPYLMDKLGRPKSILQCITVASAFSFQFYLFGGFRDETATLVYAGGITILFQIFVSGLMPMADAIVMKMLEDDPTTSTELYGRQRLWCTIAYGLISFSIGFCREHWVSSYKPFLNILIMVLAAVFTVVVWICMPRDDPAGFRAFRQAQKAAKGSPATSQPVMQVVKASSGYKAYRPTPHKMLTTTMQPFMSSSTPMRQLLTNPDFLFLLLVVLLNGLARGVMTHFMEPFQREVLQMDSTVTGLSALSGISLEVVVFLFSKPLLKRVGRVRVMLLAQACMFCRVAGYGFLPHDHAWAKYMPIFYELFKGLNYGLMQSSGVQIVKDLAPKEVQSTAQGIFTGVYSGLGQCLAGIFGYIIQNSGDGASDDVNIKVERSERMMFYTAVCSCIAFVFVTLKYEVFDRIRRKE